MANYKKSIAMVNCGNPPYNKIQEDINNMKPTTMKWIGNNIELNDNRCNMKADSQHDFHIRMPISANAKKLNPTLGGIGKCV